MKRKIQIVVSKEEKVLFFIGCFVGFVVGAYCALAWANWAVGRAFDQGLGWH